MSRMRDNASYYDAFSASYERRRRHGYHLFLDEMECDLLRRHAGPEDDVLEVGCGTGLIMERLAGDVRSVVGIDLSHGMLERAREKNLDVIRSEAVGLPFPDESFDVVYSVKVLAHVAPIREAVGEIRRVLKPGGRAVLEFYNARSLRSLRKRVVRDRVAPGVVENEVYTRYDTADALREYFADGFEVENMHGIVVVTPAAQVHAIPVVGSALRAVERAASGSPFGRFGGFLSVVARKVA